MRIAHENRAARVAKLGEDFTVYFETSKLHAQLRAIGFVEIQDVGQPQIFSCFYPNFASSILENGGHILNANTILNSK